MLLVIATDAAPYSAQQETYDHSMPHHPSSHVSLHARSIAIPPLNAISSTPVVQSAHEPIGPPSLAFGYHTSSHAEEVCCSQCVVLAFFFKFVSLTVFLVMTIIAACCFI